MDEWAEEAFDHPWFYQGVLALVLFVGLEFIPMGRRLGGDYAQKAARINLIRDILNPPQEAYLRDGRLAKRGVGSPVV